MQQQYKREIETLQRKIRWYAENQELLDKDTNALREKEEEVKRLKDTLEKVNKQVRSLKNPWSTPRVDVKEVIFEALWIKIKQ